MDPILFYYIYEENEAVTCHFVFEQEYDNHYTYGSTEQYWKM